MYDISNETYIMTRKTKIKIDIFIFQVKSIYENQKCLLIFLNSIQQKYILDKYISKTI